MNNKEQKEHDLNMRELRTIGANNGGIDATAATSVKAFRATPHNRTNQYLVRSLQARATDAGPSYSSLKGSLKKKLWNTADYMGSYKGISGIIDPEYDLLEPFSIYDTEVYVKQATARRLTLMFRNGWDVISDIDHNEKNVKYIKKRLSTMEYVMNMSTQAFFSKILFDLLLTSNCFLLKIRDEEASPGIKSEANGNKVPIAGYSFIPTSQILPYFDQGKLLFWRRYYETGIPFEDFQPEDIVHLKWDVKNGHYFGTPRLIGVIDDIFALRRLEENIELLFINHLFPLFHVQVGSEDAPCWYGPNGESEIDIIRGSIENMPKEGVFVSDQRVSVEAVGAQGNSLDTTDLISHLKQRVLSGLGVSGIDVGETDTATRTTADNVSQNLKDQIKADLTTFCDLIRMHMFKEWFQEANYSLSIQTAVATTHIRFNEIDVDNKIKMENHYIQLWLNDAVTEDEYRRMLNKPPMTVKEKTLTHSAIVFEREKELAEMGFDAQADVASMKVTAGATSGGKSGKGARKKSANKARPTNQHGTNPGPTKAKSSREYFYQHSVDRMTKLQQEFPTKSWDDLSQEVCNELASDTNINFSDYVDYTNQSCKDAYVSEIKKLMSLSGNSEILSILVDDNINRLKDIDNERLQRQESHSDNTEENSSGTSTEGS